MIWDQEYSREIKRPKNVELKPRERGNQERDLEAGSEGFGVGNGFGAGFGAEFGASTGFGGRERAGGGVAGGFGAIRVSL